MILSVFLGLGIWAGILIAAPKQSEDTFFNSSLHHRGEGMRYWYEKDDGFMQLTGIPYKDLNCKSCHVKNCDTCHAEEKDGKKFFSKVKATKNETCLPCHSREALGMKLDAMANASDVHFAAGMTCADCHGGEDVHGDGTEYSSMRQPNAVKAKCENCHTEESKDAPEFSKDVKAHKRHNKNIDCAACHVRSTMACLNCHFSEFLATGKKPGNFIPVKSWTLLMNYEGKVTSATAMTFFQKKSVKKGEMEVVKSDCFMVYAPYFTHSITKKGRDCGDCHGTEAAKQLQDGNKIRMSTFKDGKLESFKGVVPVVPDLLEWEYLDKQAEEEGKEKKWVTIPMPDPEKVKRQMVGYGTPFTEKQLRKMAKPYGAK